MRESTIPSSRAEIMKKLLLLLICLASLSFSSLLWEASTNGAVTTKPVYFQNNIVIGSLDGNVYAFSPTTGAVSWKYEIGNDILDFTVFDGDLAAATTAGKISKLKSGGAEHWTLDLSKTNNVSYVYAIASNSNYLYAVASNGIYEISKSGSARLLYEVEAPTAIAVGSNYVIFAAGNKITRIDDKGNRQWEKELDSGNFWDSNPTIDEAGASVYIGALDNRLHAYHLTGGYERWNYLTEGWVLTTPLLADSMVFIGSNDGYVYGISTSGNLKWKTALPLAAVSKPEKGVMGGTSVIFIGGTDASVYALDMDSGATVWKGSANGRITSPLFYQSKVIFGSTDGTVYAYTTERACSIDSPIDGEYIGTKELVVSGKSVSETGSQTVEVNVNNLGWQSTDTESDGSWSIVLEPNDLTDGLNSISCRVTDSGGQESGTSFTTVSIIKDSSLPLDNFIITTSTTSPIEGEQFTIYVNSKEDGSPVDRFELTVQFGDSLQTYTGDKELNLTLYTPGTYYLVAKKTGFKDGTSAVNVSYAGFDPLYIGVGAVVLLIIVWTVYSRFIRKPPAEE